MTTSEQALIDVPSHVPGQLVCPYDYMRHFASTEHPPASLDDIRDERRAFYSSLYGGHWVLTRYDDIRTAFTDYQTFGQWRLDLPPTPYVSVQLPIHLDPPEHTALRKILIPLFTARRVAQLEAAVRSTARSQLRLIAPRGSCEFTEDFALVLPAAMYCSLLGLPLDHFAVFNRIAFDMVYGTAEARREHGADAAREVRAVAGGKVRKIIEDVLTARQRQRGDDLVSFLLDARLEGDVPLSKEQVLNIAGFFFHAGTDSTGAAISYAIGYLASRPAARQRLVDAPELIPNAAEELLRYNGFHHITRQVTTDVEFAGVQMKTGDLVLLSTGAANHDSRQFPEPLDVLFERESVRHLTFGAGVHRCLGAGLATMQLRVAIEELNKAIPDYRPDPENPIEYLSGFGKIVPKRLPLIYTSVTL